MSSNVERLQKMINQAYAKGAFTNYVYKRMGVGGQKKIYFL